MMRKLVLHASFWILFFLMWNRIMYFYMNNELNRLYFSVLDVSLVITAFYSLYSYLVPAYFRDKRLGRLILFAGLTVLALSGLYAWVMGVFLNRMLIPIHFDFSWTYRDLQYNRLFIALLGVLAGCFVKLAADRFELKRHLAAVEKERAQAELTYLKAQLNPHFLFNSLNSLYTQLELGTGDAKHTLAALADMLRYQLYDCDQEMILLTKEVAYLQNYINLQQIRKDNCEVAFITEGQPEGLMIAPLLLIPFVENAFKYVSDDREQNYIRIGLKITNQTLKFSCTNTFEAQPSDHKGIGLANVKKRLDLLYTERYGLSIDMQNGIYTADLTLNLNHA